jgi:uncharacterized protein with HEPN domain
MDERIKKWLYDIHKAIEEIESFLPEGERNFFEYKQNILLKRAVEREFEIIGEAMNRILKRDESYGHRIRDARSIIGFRNQIIHAYDSISDESIWAIVIHHLSSLKKDVSTLLN